MKFINALFAALFGIHLFIITFYFAELMKGSQYRAFCTPEERYMVPRSIMHTWVSLIILSVLYSAFTRYFKPKSQKILETNWLMSFGGFAMGGYVTFLFLLEH